MINRKTCFNEIDADQTFFFAMDEENPCLNLVSIGEKLENHLLNHN